MLNLQNYRLNLLKNYQTDEVNNGSVDPSQDNMLKITGDGRKLGLDPRLINPSFEDDPGTKLNVCVNNVFDIYEKTSDKKLTQIVFCDLGNEPEWVYRQVDFPNNPAVIFMTIQKVWQNLTRLKSQESFVCMMILEIS